MQTHMMLLYSAPLNPSGQQRRTIDDEGEVYRTANGVGIDAGGDDDVSDSPGLVGREKEGE